MKLGQVDDEDLFLSSCRTVTTLYPTAGKIFRRSYSVWFTTRRGAPEKLVRFESVGEEIDSTPNPKLRLSLPLSEDGMCKGEDGYDSIRLSVIYAKSTRTPNLGSRDNPRRAVCSWKIHRGRQSHHPVPPNTPRRISASQACWKCLSTT
jgi:hypothetical protein